MYIHATFVNLYRLALSSPLARLANAHISELSQPRWREPRGQFPPSLALSPLFSARPR